ncbi:hypothetical protein FQR65_LT06138 [Abscondita terminalis]|nr:hypothetical protein FQR65_LT06138 [Abscondita terminalis]
MRNWFHDRDILTVDRGYRDAGPLLEAAAFYRGCKCIPFGSIKSIFKFFEHLIAIHHIDHLDDFYRIAGALISKYHPLIEMVGCNADLANAILIKANVVKARVEQFSLKNRHGGWVRLDAAELDDFPHLDLGCLKEITCGVYLNHLAPSYIQDKLQRDDTDELQIDQFNVEPGRARVYSRFRKATKYQIWIAYAVVEHQNQDPEDHPEEERILGHYSNSK